MGIFLMTINSSVYVVIATHLAIARVWREIKRLPEDYRRRWGIEI